MTEKIKPPTWYWIVTIIALLWNLAGVANYIRNVTMTEEMLATYSAAEQELITSVPTWSTAAFAFAVWGGVLGCIALIIRKAWAYHVFIVSLAGILVQMFYNLAMSNMLDVYGLAGAILPLMVIPIGIFLVWMSKKAISSGWIT